MAAEVSSSPPLTCKLCTKAASTTCGKCLKVFYCSVTCSLKDAGHLCILNPVAMAQRCITFLNHLNGFSLFQTKTNKIERAFSYIDFDNPAFSILQFKRPDSYELACLYPQAAAIPTIPTINLAAILTELAKHNKKERMIIVCNLSKTLSFCIALIPK